MSSDYICMRAKYIVVMIRINLPNPVIFFLKAHLIQPLQLDLGSKNHPRHSRSIECTESTFFYGHIVCQPRKFPVRVLQRIPNVTTIRNLAERFTQVLLSAMPCYADFRPFLTILTVKIPQNVNQEFSFIAM